MPGYRLPLRVEEIDARYICVHCKLLLKNPFLTGCGHLYCHSCIELLIRNPKETPYCKIDGMKLERAFEDLNTRAEIMQFVVMCPFHSQGCKWVGKVQHFEFHQGMCAFFSGTSHNMDFNRAYQSEHVVQDSKHQLVDSSPSDRDNMKDGAGADVGSISDDSITLVKRCPFHLQGCPWVGEVKHLQMHVFREHESVYEGVDFRNDHSYEDQPSNASFTEQDSGERQLQTRINRLEEKEVEVERRFDDQNMESSLIFGGLSRRMELIEGILASQNVTRAELEQYLKLHQFLNYESQLVWKITEFDRKRSEAVNGQKLSFDSPCFYTSRYGYKMCARIYLNGNGMGRGTHISLFFVVMRGEYDSILRWPFRQRVTFMLLDQDDVGHVIDAFRPDPNSSSFQRPRGETNIASGCPTFVSIEELNNHAYVREDTIFIKIIVDVSD